MTEFLPVEVNTGSIDHDDQLAMKDGKLVAVLVRLEPRLHGHAGWAMEEIFPLKHTVPAVFDTLEQAEE